jgi:hypothetical protein
VGHSTLNSLAGLDKQAQVSIAKACQAPKTLLLLPYKVKQVQVIEREIMSEIRIFVNVFSEAVHSDVLDSQLIFSTDEA